MPALGNGCIDAPQSPFKQHRKADANAPTTPVKNARGKHMSEKSRPLARQWSQQLKLQPAKVELSSTC
jgi:hypothetical protein